MRRLVFCLFGALVAACSSSSSGDPKVSESPDTGATDAPKDSGAPDAPSPPPCSGKPGTFHDQALESGGEKRRYWLHVPASYRCDKPAALVVDFHGTGFDQTGKDPVEESWATSDLVSASDDLGFIVLRPRSRSRAMNGGFVYQWDINPGDVAKNKAFAEALVADLRTKYNVHNTRMYATGFSNGPGMAVQFLGDDTPLFHGYGLVAGGVNTPVKRSEAFGSDAPRIYTMTGFRDYMLVAKDGLQTFLDKYAHPKERRFDREADTGHEVYGWHFREAFAWMDRGERPAAGVLAKEWTIEPGIAAGESIVEIGDGPTSLVAVGSRGGVYTRSAGVWTQRASLASIAPLTDVCFLADGRGFAAGHGHVATTLDGAEWRVLDTVPEFGAEQFGFTYATSVGCLGARVTVGGVWSAATSTDGGKSWSAAQTGQAFVSAVRSSPSGWLATGYWNYASTAADGMVFTASPLPGETQWWNDGAFASPSRVFLVGEAGALLRSDDAGTSFSAVVSGTKEDLYAVTFRGARGAAVGAHGAVVVTTDGGATWSPRPTGLDAFVGGARFVDDRTVVVGGGGGIVRTTL